MRRLLTAVILAVAVMTVGISAPASAVRVGNEGCTPGYWKNHTDNWEEAAPGQLLSSIYSEAANTSLSGNTLLEALQGNGGSGVEGAERILARAAVAAWLNSAHEGLGFPWRRNATGLNGEPALVSAVNAAFASQNRATMLDLARTLDQDNNLGCPLN